MKKKDIEVFPPELDKLLALLGQMPMENRLPGKKKATPPRPSSKRPGSKKPV